MRVNDSWHDDALCAAHPEPDLWFSEWQREIAAAKIICTTCPVRSECLREGLTNVLGVWGGLDEFERAELMGRTIRRKIDIASV